MHPHIIYKQRGENLAELVVRARQFFDIPINTPITYAGRLDPLAEGVMILLSGDDVHHKEIFLGLDKVYTVTVVLGITTDSYDVLGMPTLQNNNMITKENIIDVLYKQKNITTQTYPQYSSKTVNGVPLWKHTRDGNQVELPTRDVKIHDVILIETSIITASELLKQVRYITDTVQGDFRQNEIYNTWEKIFSHDETFHTLVIRYHVGSGTYIRNLVHELGQDLGTGAVILKLVREQVGDYIIEK